MPIVWHIMKGYAAQGFKGFVLCLDYKGWAIKEFFLNYRVMTTDVTVRLGENTRVEFHGRGSEDDWTVTLADTGEQTMTGGRVAAVRRYVEGDGEFMLPYGDGVSDIDLNWLLAFVEKPQTTEGFINGGFFVFDERRVWKYFTGGPEMVLEQKPLRAMVRDRELIAYEHTGFWQPIKTLREYNLLNELWAQRRAPWRVWP